MPDTTATATAGRGGTAVPLARSQISLGGRTEVRDGWEVGLPPATPAGAARTAAAAGPASLTVADASRLTKVTVRAARDGGLAAGLPPFGRCERDANGTLRVGSGPGEWLLLSATRTAADLDADLGGDRDAELVSVVDVSHGRAMLRLTGEAAVATLAKLAAIDLSDRRTPNGTALRCSVAGLVTDVIRDDRGARPSFLLHCERSSGQYLYDVLADAGAEFALRAVVATGPELLG